MHLIFIYLGILFGILLEGEMILLSAIIAAHHGYLKFWLVIVIGVAGTYCSDSLYFFLGRKKGKAWLDKNQKIKNKVSVINKKLENYPILVFVFYRFFYGFRAITPLVIGTSKTSTVTFLFYSGISTIIWVIFYSSIGYIFGEFIKSELGHIEHIEKYIIGFLVLISITSIIIFRIKKQKSSYGEGKV